MLKNKSKIPTTTGTDYETEILQVNKINAKIHDLNIESMKEVERLQFLIKEYQEITKMMYSFSEFGNRYMKKKIQTFCSAMERGEKE